MRLLERKAPSGGELADRVVTDSRGKFLRQLFGAAAGAVLVGPLMTPRAIAQTIGNGPNTPTNFVDARTFGASPTATAATNTTAIQNAINYASAQNLPLFLKDIYPVNAGLTWNANNVAIFGVNAMTSGLKVTGSQTISASILSVGNGQGAAVSPPNFWNLAYVRDIGIYGDVSANTLVSWTSGISLGSMTNYNAGLLLNGIIGCEVRNVAVRNFPIGFNMTNNCYKSSFTNCTTFSGECFVGMYLADTVSFGAGNDMTFVNCWISAFLSAIMIGANGGGYHFFGGQLQSGNSGGVVTADLLGVITTGVQLQNPTTVFGIVANIEFTGVSFESPNNVWVHRALGPGCVAVYRNCGFLCDTSSIGIYKPGSSTQNFGYNEHVSFYNCRFGGGNTAGWKSTLPIIVNGDSGGGTGGSNTLYYEVDTTGFATFSGVNSGASLDYATLGMLIASQVVAGKADNDREQLIQGGLMLRDNAGTLQKSSNWGTTWASVP